MVIDSHTHLDSKEFDNDRTEVIARAREAGVKAIINIGASEKLISARRSVDLAEKYDFIFASVGLHPHDAEEPLNTFPLQELCGSNKVVAIGETGLDFYRDWSPKEKQYEWFEAQIALAREVKLPLIIHSRDSAEDCYQFLKQHKASEVGGVFHCYSEDAEFAKKLFDINFIVSFPGIVSFKNAKKAQQAAKQIPLDKIMVETDAPYLAPVPYRGKRCEPAYVVETAEAIAELRGCSFSEVARQASLNAIRLFGLPESLLEEEEK